MCPCAFEVSHCMIKGNPEKVITELTRGSERAFEQLFHMYYPRLNRYAQTFLHNQSEAEDLVQDVFVQIWDRREEVNSEKHFASFIFTLVKNRCLNSLKKKIIEDKFLISQLKNDTEQLYHISFNSDVEFTSLEERLYHELLAIIAEMPERCQLAFSLKWLEGKKIREIAEIMCISTTMVDKHLSNGLKIARQKLSPEMFLFLIISKG